MRYSRAIHGRQDAAALANLFRRIGAELRRQRDAGPSLELRRQDDAARVVFSASAPAVQPDGKGAARFNSAPILTAPDICLALPSRTEAGRLEGAA